MDSRRFRARSRRLRSRAWRQRRYRRGGDDPDIAGNRERDPQCDRRADHLTADSARPPGRPSESEERGMTNSAVSAATPSAEFRAAGTDLSERRRSGVSRGPLIDLVRPKGTPDIFWNENGAARISAFATIAALAADARLGTAYPGLTAAAAGLATPHPGTAPRRGRTAGRRRCHLVHVAGTGSPDQREHAGAGRGSAHAPP